MGPGLIAFTGFIYLFTAISLYLSGKAGLAITFLGYAFANIGLYMAAQ
jgi:hypothetical protein